MYIPYIYVSSLEFPFEELPKKGIFCFFNFYRIIVFVLDKM